MTYTGRGLGLVFSLAPVSTLPYLAAGILTLVAIPLALAASSAAPSAGVETKVAACSSECFGVAVDHFGNVYVADTYNNRILMETPSATGYAQSIIATGFNKPYGVAVDLKGNIYVADSFNRRIVKGTFLAGTYATSVIASDLPTTPMSVAVDALGDVYFAVGNSTVFASPYVYKLTPSGSGYTQTVVAGPSSGMRTPWEVAVDFEGNVFVTDSEGNSVYKETPSGSSYSQSIVATGLDFPTGVAVDSRGNVYVANAYTNQILMESPISGGGYFQSVYATGTLSFPYELATDTLGSLYIANPQHFDVLKETPASASSTVAADVYIQIQGPEGAVYGFRASSSGRLSTIPGSPFKPAGEIVGGTPTKFFTLGKTLIHSYGISSDGAIGAQLSQIPFFDYSGDGCGPSNSGQEGAVLDHTGKYIYVLLGCGGAEYQSYLISSDGAFTFAGDTEESWGSSDWNSPIPDLPSILGNEGFAYADYVDGHESGLIGFRRTYPGTLELMQFAETDPTLGPCDGQNDPRGPDASPVGNYVVLQLYPCDEGPAYLGSYTVDPEGNISTTNTSSDMPRSSIVNRSTFSPSGDLFVAYGGGIEIYRFNGAAPLTLWKTLMTSTYINQVAWDGSNHLYAISSPENKLYVFTVTPTSVTETSSINIGSPFKMIVVSR